MDKVYQFNKLPQLSLELIIIHASSTHVGDFSSTQGVGHATSQRSFSGTSATSSAQSSQISWSQSTMCLSCW